MKQTFTKLMGIASLAILMIAGTEAKAQTLASAETNKKTQTTTTKTETTTEAPKADPDTAWKPQRRVWGYAFGDFSYVGDAPPILSMPVGATANSQTPFGKENNYYQVPKGRNQFQFRRIYLGYDYEITKKFKAEMLLEAAPNENTQPAAVSGATTGIANGDNLADGKMAFYIKNFNLRTRDIWNGTDFVIGEMSTPGFALNEPGTNAPTSLSETTWGYRSIEKTITDFHSNNSFDVGAALQGTFDPATKNFGYVLMVGNNTKATDVTIYNNTTSTTTLSPTNPQPNTGFFKIFYGDIWGKFANGHVVADVYADYVKTSSTIASTAVTAGSIGPQEHNMEKLFVAYLSKPFNLGVEAYTQKIGNAVVDNTAKVADDATVRGISVWARGAFAPGWNYFARYDNYNPDTKFIAGDVYASPLTNYSAYDPTVKQQFYTFGIDYNPTKNVHFMPNVWIDQYKSQYSSTTNGYLPGATTAVYRLTFFFTFGK
jgi:hypothetical protein